MLRRYFLSSVLFSLSFSVFSAEWLVKSRIEARGEYNDNIFLTSLPHDGVYALKVIPSVDAIVREKQWQLGLNARISNNRYSDSTLDSNDEYYTLSGSYNGERNIFSLNANYTLDSNLSSVSSDFGVFGRRINREIKGISPSYTHLLTERSTLVLSYSFSETDYLDDVEASRFIPFEIQSLSGSYLYDLTEKNRLNLTLQLSDYQSADNRTEYTILTTRYGIEYDFSETLMVDFLVGVSRQKVTNRFTQTFDFFGNPVTSTRETESSNRSLVLDAGIEKIFETSSVSGRISQSDRTDSLGNLNQIESLSVSYQRRLSDLWRYNSNARYENIQALSSVVGRNTSVDRELFLFDTTMSYRITRVWTANFSYRYIARKFRSDNSADRAPRSNLISVAITYNFPSFTTF